MSKIAVVSYRLGLADGVSVEAAKWAGALGELGHHVTTVAGEGVADVLIDGLRLDAEQPPDVGSSRALGDADVVLVENICSLPLNRAAADAVADQLEGTTCDPAPSRPRPAAPRARAPRRAAG